MVYHFDTECSYLLRGTYSNYGGMALYTLKQPSLKTEHEVVLLKEKGGHMYTPRKYPTSDYYH